MTDKIIWTTRLDWNGSQHIVHLSRDGHEIAAISLDDWATLSATTLLIDCAREQTTDRETGDLPSSAPARDL